MGSYRIGAAVILTAALDTLIMSNWPTAGISERARSVLVELDQTWFTDNKGFFGTPGRRVLVEMIATEASFTMRGQDLSGFALTPFVHEPRDSGPRPQMNDPVKVPMKKDGDVADFYRRVIGKEHPTFKGELSAEYKAFLEEKVR